MKSEERTKLFQEAVDLGFEQIRAVLEYRGFDGEVKVILRGVILEKLDGINKRLAEIYEQLRRDDV